MQHAMKQVQGDLIKLALAGEFSGQRIGYPAIVAGLANGDWSVISAIINEELQGEDHTFMKFVD